MDITTFATLFEQCGAFTRAILELGQTAAGADVHFLQLSNDGDRFFIGELRIHEALRIEWRKQIARRPRVPLRLHAGECSWTKVELRFSLRTAVTAANNWMMPAMLAVIREELLEQMPLAFVVWSNSRYFIPRARTITLL
jgi:hypothetical protein